ncbi:MAG: ATP-binding protein [Bacteroidota bacterium]
MLLFVTGLPGTGKTTFARALAESLKAIHLNTDIIRDLLDMRGMYDDASKMKVYDELLKKTDECLQNGHSVIVDGTFYKMEVRQPFIDVGIKHGHRIEWIEIKASEQIIAKRVSQKRTYSEADYEVYLYIKSIYEPLQKEHLTLWSDQHGIEEMILLTIKHYDFTI